MNPLDAVPGSDEERAYGLAAWANLLAADAERGRLMTGACLTPGECDELRELARKLRRQSVAILVRR